MGASLGDRAFVSLFIATLAALLVLASVSHAPSTSAHPQRSESTTAHDRPGFWGPADATIDWCEHNYVVSYYIAEFYNTISNLLLVLSGAFGVRQAIRYGWETRFIVAGTSLVVVGFGSAAYHATLMYWAQMWDEVPMVWVVLIFIYINTRMDQEHSPRLALGLFLYGGVWTLLHSHGAFVFLFQLHFGALALFNLYLNCRVLRDLCHIPLHPFSGGTTLPQAAKDLRRMVLLTVCYCTLGFLMWIVDQVACDALHHLPGRLPNPQFHAWWHLFVGLGTHLLLQSAVATRLALQRRAPPATWWALRGCLGFAVPKPADLASP